MFMETDSGQDKAASKPWRYKETGYTEEKHCFSADKTTAVSVYTFLLPLTHL